VLLVPAVWTNTFLPTFRRVLVPSTVWSSNSRGQALFSFELGFIIIFLGGGEVTKLEAFRRIRKITKSDYVASSCLSVRPSVRMGQLG
jgi:hypothetical protein